MADSEFWHRTADERAAEITRLRSENEALREDISRYVSRDTERLAEVEKLREALKPFAIEFDGKWQDGDELTAWKGGGETSRSLGLFTLTVGEVRRARAVLTGTEAPQEENVTEPLGEAHFSDPKPLG